MTRRGIVLAGTVILDIVHMIDHWPQEELVAMVSATHLGAGGPPHNAAAGLVKLGADFPVTCIGVLGDDPYADQLAGNAASYGLDVSHMRRIKGAVTSHTQVMTSLDTGRRTFFHQVGVNAVMEPDWLLPADDSAKIYYVGSPGIAKKMDDTEGWAKVLKAARARGFKTALEMVPVDPRLQTKLVPPLLPLVDIFVVNDVEAEAVSGLPVTQDGRLKVELAYAACQKLLDLGVGDVVAIHHPDGAVGLTRDGTRAKAGSVNVPKSDIVGAVGAGDAFYAGFLFGWHEEWPLEKCLALANAAAATSLASPTTSASIKPWQQSLDYAAEKKLKNL